jgi:hypothetical protein
MKKYIITLLAIVFIGLNINAQSTNSTSGKEFGGIEVTLGGAGTEIDNESSFGLDFSISTNPFERIPQVWVGIVQGLFWEPTFAGSTDLTLEWSQPIWKDTLYVNPGWSVGSVYDRNDYIWRTGPQLTFQYYTSDNAFIYAGANYDIVSKGDNGFRYSFGVGLSF